MKHKLTAEDICKVLIHRGQVNSIVELTESRWFTKSKTESLLNYYGWTKEEVLKMLDDHYQSWSKGDTK